MPSRPVTALLVVEPGVDPGDVQDSLPADADFNVAAVVTGAEEALGWLRSHPADLLLVACAGYSDRALLLLDAVAQQNPDVNVMVLGSRVAERLPQARVRGRRRRHRDAPGDPEQVRFEVHKMLARKQGADTAGGSETSRGSSASSARRAEPARR